METNLKEDTMDTPEHTPDHKYDAAKEATPASTANKETYLAAVSASIGGRNPQPSATDIHNDYMAAVAAHQLALQERATEAAECTFAATLRIADQQKALIEPLTKLVIILLAEASKDLAKDKDVS
jgi:hypothetical protein